MFKPDLVISLSPAFFDAIIAVNHRTDFFTSTDRPTVSIDFSSRNVQQVIRKRKYTRVFRGLNVNWNISMKVQASKQKTTDKVSQLKWIKKLVLSVRFCKTEKKMPKHDIWSRAGLHIFLIFGKNWLNFLSLLSPELEAIKNKLNLNSQ